MKKVILVDDEEAGRQLIREYLEDYAELVIVGEANNGVDAIRLIEQFQPDLIFLDVEMPGMTGFELLTHLEEIPEIIFSTAYDQYALKAFEVHAVDYLLKPYTRERFAEAVKRVNNRTDSNPVMPLAQSLLQQDNPYPAKILVQHQQKLIAVDVPEIIRIQAYGDYSKLTTAKGTFLSNYGISALEEKLDPQHFLRVHRSSIVGLSHIREVQRYGNGFSIQMSDQEEVRVSRGYADRVKQIIF